MYRLLHRLVRLHLHLLLSGLPSWWHPKPLHHLRQKSIRLELLNHHRLLHLWHQGQNRPNHPLLHRRLARKMLLHLLYHLLPYLLLRPRRLILPLHPLPHLRQRQHHCRLPRQHHP
jgi:hypothetical protein